MLRALPPEDMAYLAPLLKPVSLPLHHVFNEPGQEIRNCYFLISGMASTVAVMKDGSTSEVGIIGSEGLVGFAAMLGVGTAQNLTIVQVAGDGLRVDAEKLRALYHQSPAFRCLVERFIWSTLAFYAQCAACNRFHSLEERMSRWLLTVRDRINDNSLPLTHEFLGQMLGAHRSTVTLALGAFERSAVLHNRRGKIELTDLARLEKSSCECLEAIRKLPSFNPANDATTNGTIRSTAV